MEPFNSVDAPSIDRGVRERLRRLDPDLFLSFSVYAIHPATGQPLPVNRRADDGPERYENRNGDLLIISPAHHLWVRDSDGRIHLVMSYPASQGFGHREVLKLEQDVARTMRPSEIVEVARQRREERKKKEREAYKQRHLDIAKANMSRIQDLANGKSGFRTRKAASYAGQTNRGTPEQRFLSDYREDGWELPED